MSAGGLAGDSAVASGSGVHRAVDRTGFAVSGDPTAPSEAIRENLTRVLTEAGHIILSRHNKYGPKNIANAPGGALTGILVRLHDKLSRLAFGISDHPDESVEDAFFDTLGYAAIALLVIRGEWPA